MSKPLVYLAGTIKHTSYTGATHWRQNAARYLNELGIATLDPMRGKDFLKGLMPLGATFGETFDFERDRWDVQNCDVIFCNLMYTEQVSIGTVIEIAWADVFGKYIVVAMNDNNIHQHGMLRQTASIVFNDFEEALRYIPTLLAGRY